MITIDSVFLGAAIHGAALVLLLAFNGYSNRQANFLLAGLVGLLTITMWNVYILKIQGPLMFHIIDYHLWATPLLWAPLLYLYTGLLIKKRTLQWKSIAHTFPALFIGLLQIPLHFYQSTELGIELLDFFYKAVVIFIYPQLGLYLFHSFKILREYQIETKDQFSTLEKINLTWLIVILTSFSSILLFDMTMNFLIVFGDFKLTLIYDIVLLLEALMVFAIGYFSLRQPEILTGSSAKNHPVKNPITTKYIGSPIDKQLGAELADQLDKMMIEQKTYLTNDLTLTQLADSMALGTHHMSQIINQHRHKNFYDYINEYRAQHAAGYLAKRGKTNLTRLAYESGFNNRVSFNKAFRKYTGQTPTEFLKRQEIITQIDA
ncbi:helix-turn-helix domain-containing protein [Kiloniella sp. EL199]|uniref:AraC family transcriptional regulator n=1 Tax=Kiloniella sp. EL199 TaxID=2107581 RepID=UPI000EA0B5A5|nr:helix-turn-helix domain-containing protein [Kiloniella sp. EL199]